MPHTLQVLDVQSLKQGKTVTESLRPASLYKKTKKQIGKKFVPIMNARLLVTVPGIQFHQYMGLPELQQDLPLAPFNWRSSTAPVINSPQDQGQCGSCWAVSSASAIGDQWAIALNKQGKAGVKTVMLSPMNLTNCTPNEDCNVGGSPSDAGITASWDPSRQRGFGLVSEKCWPYSCDCSTWDANNKDQRCMQMTSCYSQRWYTDAKSIRSAMALKPGVTVPHSVDDIDVPKTIQLIQSYIKRYGPVVTGFSVPSDFMNIPSGDSSYIYQSKDPTKSVGGHAVVIVGWNYKTETVNGKKQQVLFWIIRNSWGTSWGDGGYFRAYAYPRNNVGFDVPLFYSNNNTVHNAETAISAATNSPFTSLSRFGLGVDSTAQAWGGVTLWQVDTVHSPQADLGKSNMNQQVKDCASLKDGKDFAASSTSSTSYVMFAIMIAVSLAVIAILFLYFKKQRK